MKTLLSLTFVALLLVASAGKCLAHYDHDDRGWYDEHHHHHAFIMHHGHRGYWDKDDHGARIFISL